MRRRPVGEASASDFAKKEDWRSVKSIACSSSVHLFRLSGHSGDYWTSIRARGRQRAAASSSGAAEENSTDDFSVPTIASLLDTADSRQCNFLVGHTGARARVPVSEEARGPAATGWSTRRRSPRASRPSRWLWTAVVPGRCARARVEFFHPRRTASAPACRDRPRSIPPLATDARFLPFPSTRPSVSSTPTRCAP